MTLLTTHLEVDLYPADTLAELYHVPWQVELSLRHLKSKSGMDKLSGLVVKVKGTFKAPVSNGRAAPELEAS